MIYAVYIGGQDTHAEVDETGQRLSAKARISQNKAVRAGVAAVLTSKAASRSMDSVGSSEMPVKKEVRVKKEKKEKTGDELKEKEFKTDCAKFLSYILFYACRKQILKFLDVYRPIGL